MAQLTKCGEERAPVEIESGEAVAKRLLDAAELLVATVRPKVTQVIGSERLEARPTAVLGIAWW
ncbi:hypothetical protein E2562_000233 [Oryza meyeriana var. granulata]|uniref:Uncharacterized protein n=1 Tax=Oryza meyeriana var. granulata TaxID=110450 RepID=A0A6G1CMH2_9ORYZ|nr:hypothetical protein E2562_000233 [Oryza meyeriana var. granulata]